MTLARHALRVALGVFLVAAGVLHLTSLRTEFQAQVPSWFPVDADLVVVVSGVVEIALGLALLLAPARLRRLTGLVVAVFFVAVFPGNVAQYVEGTSAFGLDTDGARLTRLFFQPVLVLAALWACGWFGPKRAELGRTAR
ncbi:DoxX family membrane protein [Nocardioides zeae]|uniref:Membrane protein n=1 Tax=Nocardioides zeae TaxID=1457234 RepID=A0AAJ1X0C7_9ACTN|nr:DoxX family membrane protein [Nocardioides zeae]MDQ1102979.1 putative membrane protein [Nocardioides zeae]